MTDAASSKTTGRLFDDFRGRLPLESPRPSTRLINGLPANSGPILGLLSPGFSSPAAA